MFRHPNYYKELRKRNKTDQAISKEQPDGVHTSVRPGPGHKLQAREDSTVNRVAEPQASSAKPQASSVKPQALQDTSDKHQAPSSKRQA